MTETEVFHASWLRLNEVVAELGLRGISEQEAHAQITRAIASGTMVRPDQNPARPFAGALRFRVHADIRQSAGTAWRAAPSLDFPASTIEVPSRGHAGWAQLETKLRWQLIEIWADDTGRLWPWLNELHNSQPTPILKADLDQNYLDHVAAEKGLREWTTIKQDRDWAKTKGVSRDRMRILRRASHRNILPDYDEARQDGASPKTEQLGGN